MIKNGPPKCIFFDLGNVLISFDHSLACRQMAKVLGTTGDRVFEFLFSSGLELKYEEGLLTTAQLFEKFSREFSWSGDPHSLSHAAADIFELNVATVSLVAELKAKRSGPLGILSNTSEIHFEFIKEKFPFVYDFDQWVLSYEVMAMKPYRKIFEAACLKVGFAPADCFFVDDILANVEGAVEAGIDAVLYQGADKLRQDLVERNLL